MAAPEGFTDTAAIAPHWWTPPWDTSADPDGAWSIPGEAGEAWHETGGRVPLDDSAILDPLEEQFGEQVRDAMSTILSDVAKQGAQRSWTQGSGNYWTSFSEIAPAG